MARGERAIKQPGHVAAAGYEVPAVTTDLARRGMPFLAAVAAVMVRGQVLRDCPDEQAVRAFARVNPGTSERSALQGAALSFAERGRLQTWAIGQLAPGGPDTASGRHWRAMYESRAGARYEPGLTSDALKQLFYDQENPWAAIVRTPRGSHFPVPLLVSTFEDGELAVYDPRNEQADMPPEYTMTVEDLAGRALYRSFGLLAVRAHDAPLDGTVISPSL